MFLRETVLPMAVQTNALIILTFDHCNLSKAMGTMVEAEAAKAGGRLPFTVINVSFASSHEEQSKQSGSVCEQLRCGSKRWRQAEKKVSNCEERSDELRMRYFRF